MRLAHHFHPSDDKRNEEEKRFYLKKHFNPGRGADKYIDVHEDFIQHKFDSWKCPIRVVDNLSQRMRKALEKIEKDES